MEYKKVARVAEKFSQIGIGCWVFSGNDVWDSSNDNESIKIIHEAIDCGINFFDVAPVYGYGHAETVLGKALSGGKRQKVLVATKCGLLWNEKRQTRNDLSKASILVEIDQSLKRLGTDYIDIYQLHWPDHSTPLDETLEAIDEIKKAGKIRYFGVTNFSLADVQYIMERMPIDTQQGLYNMLERNPTSYHNIPLEYKTEKEILPYCLEHGQAYFPYSPLFQGLLTGKFKRKDNFSSKDVRNANPKLVEPLFSTYYAKVEELVAFAQKIGHPLNEIAFNWLRQNPAITSIIAGASSVAQLKDNLKALTWELSQDELDEIAKIIAPFENL